MAQTRQIPLSFLSFCPPQQIDASSCPLRPEDTEQTAAMRGIVWPAGTQPDWRLTSRLHVSVLWRLIALAVLILIHRCIKCLTFRMQMRSECVHGPVKGPLFFWWMCPHGDEGDGVLGTGWKGWCSESASGDRSVCCMKNDTPNSVDNSRTLIFWLVGGFIYRVETQEG